MASRRLRLVLLLILGLPAFSVVSAAPAWAADECGTDWHKESNGLLSGSNSYSGFGRSMTASVSGYVRYCTRERSLRPDQANQRILIGIPETVVSTGSFSGAMKKRCLKQVVTVVFAHQDQTTSIGLSGKSAGFSVDYKDSSVEFSRSKCFDEARATFESTGMVLTASDQSGCAPSSPGTAMWIYCTTMHPHVKSIKIETTASSNFVNNGVNRSPEVVQSELDTSAST